MSNISIKTTSSGGGGGVIQTSLLNDTSHSRILNEQDKYYNNNTVIRGRLGTGITGGGSGGGGGGTNAIRSSVHERHNLVNNSNDINRYSGNQLNRMNIDNLYRSNSSLELVNETEQDRGVLLTQQQSTKIGKRLQQHHQQQHQHQLKQQEILPSSNLRREYGSHGSIDVISTNHRPATMGESFFAMLQDYRPAVLNGIGTDQRSPGPAEYLKGKLQQSTDSGGVSNTTSMSALTAASSSINSGHIINSTISSSSSSSSVSGIVSLTSHNNNNNNQYHQLQHHHQQQQQQQLQQQQQQQQQNQQQSQNYSNDSWAGEDRPDMGSPKFKLNRLWHGQSKSSSRNNNHQTETPHVSANDECSFITTLSADVEERQRRRAFAHFDCQSLTANLGYAAKLRGLLLARRRNTTTGASAASMLSTRASTPDGNGGNSNGGTSATVLATAASASVTSTGTTTPSETIDDYGDGQSNELLENCPFFRNEIGGEEEREVSLTRFQSSIGQRRAIHRPALAYGVSVLECNLGETLWSKVACPFQRTQRPIESIDIGARYYRQYFHGQEHQNWFGMDEQLGPVAISIKREKFINLTATTTTTTTSELISSTTNIETTTNNNNNNTKEPAVYLFRMIVRTSELLTLRGSILEESVPHLRGSGKTATAKDVLEYVAPEIHISALKLGIQSTQCEQQLLKLDEQGLTNKYKVGILYCKKGQGTEEDMYNNEETGPAFMEFLETIGKCVRLKGFDKYKAGLDNKTDSTGTHSLYATIHDCEIMFHVSTMLPFTPNNRQQLLRKRHIGNDIVTIVFQEPGSLPFTPKNIRSQFQHVFIIVHAINPCTDMVQYKVAVSRSKEVPVFGPPIYHPGAIYHKGKTFADFLLLKIINAENAAHRSEKFATMATRTRQEYLKDLCTNYCTPTPVDSGPKFSIFPSKKKERPKPRFNGDKTQRGAFCWQVVLNDTGQSTMVDCFLGISCETFVLIEECTRQIVFVTPCKSILGWSTSGSTIRIYHHQSECVMLSMRESTEHDEQLEVIERLRAVTTGCGALELNLRRNLMGQLGFHVQPDGVVTQVEQSGQAWTAGLRQGYRLVDICKVAVATLSHDEMVDLLKTSSQVTVTVIESFSDHTPRRGCFYQDCKFNIINYETNIIGGGGGGSVGGGGSGGGGGGGSGGLGGGSNGSGYGNSGDYENLDDKLKLTTTTKAPATPQLKQPGGNNHRRRYERNFSPPRSSNSSGYGTGSSSRSFTVIPNSENNNNNNNSNMRFVTDMGTLTSSSSGHSSTDDRWYDILEVPDTQETMTTAVASASTSTTSNHHPHFHNHHHHHLQQQQQPQHHQSPSINEIKSLAASNNNNNNNNQSPQHHQYHSKISHTSSLPLSNVTRPLSIHEPFENNNKHHQPQPQQQQQQQQPTQSSHLLAMNKSTGINDLRPLPHTANIEYLLTKSPRINKDNNINTTGHILSSVHGTTTNDGTNNSNSNIEPIYSVSMKCLARTEEDKINSISYSHHSHQSQHNQTLGEEDIIPGGHLRRSSTASSIYKSKNNIINGASSAVGTGGSGGGGSSSTSSSCGNVINRNKSPRPGLLSDPKLRLGVVSSRSSSSNSNNNNSNNHHSNHHHQRNSVNYTSSTLQEDLMKLINPDYMLSSSDDNFHQGALKETRPQKNLQNSNSLGNISSLMMNSGGGGGSVTTTEGNGNNNGRSIQLKTPLTNIITDDLLLMRKKSRSREAINLGSHGHPVSNLHNMQFNDDDTDDQRRLLGGNGGGVGGISGGGAVGRDKKLEKDIILTTAHPAQIISAGNAHLIKEIDLLTKTTATKLKQIPQQQQQSTASNILHINEENPNLLSDYSYLSIKNIDNNQQLPMLPNSKEVDWSKLVDNAIKQVNEGLKISDTIKKEQLQPPPPPPPPPQTTTQSNTQNDELLNESSYLSNSVYATAPSSVAGTYEQLLSSSTTTSLPKLQNQVSQLEDRITKEKRRRKSLEQAVRRLTDENRRLQDESQAAVQQLRRFTEWFFQTIDKQS